ncbi:unnamed protein product [Cochlearia groenlandica]
MEKNLTRLERERVRIYERERRKGKKRLVKIPSCALSAATTMGEGDKRRSSTVRIVSGFMQRTVDKGSTMRW